jgi:hypothetical protein
MRRRGPRPARAASWCSGCPAPPSCAPRPVAPPIRPRLGPRAPPPAARALAERTGDAARTRTASGQGGTGHQRRSGRAASPPSNGSSASGSRRARAGGGPGAPAQAVGALDASLARQLADVQQLLRDALTPELARQLAEVERAAGQQAQGGAMQQSLEQLARGSARSASSWSRAARCCAARRSRGRCRRSATTRANSRPRRSARRSASPGSGPAEPPGGRGRPRGTGGGRRASSPTARARWPPTWTR